MAYVVNEEVNVSYGRLDFSSLGNENMKNLYYGESEEFDREVKDSCEIGQPVNAQAITQDYYIENSLDKEGDIDELFDAE